MADDRKGISKGDWLLAAVLIRRPPRIIAVTVGMAMRATSRQRTRQLLSAKRDRLRSGGCLPGPAGRRDSVPEGTSDGRAPGARATADPVDGAYPCGPCPGAP